MVLFSSPFVKVGFTCQTSQGVTLKLASDNFAGVEGDSLIWEDERKSDELICILTMKGRTKAYLTDFAVGIVYIKAVAIAAFWEIGILFHLGMFSLRYFEAAKGVGLAIVCHAVGADKEAIMYSVIAVMCIVSACAEYGMAAEVAVTGRKGTVEIGISGKANKGDSNSILNKTPEEISNMSRKELESSIPDGWDFQNHNGRIHIKDENGSFRVRIDPPDKVTDYTHIHLFDKNGNPLDILGNIVSRKDPSGHIPYNE